MEVNDIQAVVAELRRRDVMFEEVDVPGLRTVDGIAADPRYLDISVPPNARKNRRDSSGFARRLHNNGPKIGTETNSLIGQSS